jgi:hypothetical protein
MIALVRRGSSDGGDFPKLDLSTVRFPSDDLTIRILRQAHPRSFDVGIVGGEDAQPRFFFQPLRPDHVDSTVAAMLYWERMLAANAYAAAAGIKRIDTGFSYADITDELTQLYSRYELASGPHHAAQLIRDFEQQAAELGRQKEP